MKHDWEFYLLLTSGKYRARCRACGQLAELGEFQGISTPSLELEILKRKVNEKEGCKGENNEGQ